MSDPSSFSLIFTTAGMILLMALCLFQMFLLHRMVNLLVELGRDLRQTLIESEKVSGASS